MHEPDRLMPPDLESKFTFIHLDCTQSQNFWNIYHAILDMGHRKRNGNKKERKCDNRNVAGTWSFVSDSET